MRYIIATNDKTGECQPFIGLAPINHKQLAEQAALLGFNRPTSAGFAHLGPALGVTTHYRSEGLGLSPHADDARLIHTHYRATLDLVPEFQMPEPTSFKTPNHILNSVTE
jgi:hypothetical protein